MRTYSEIRAASRALRDLRQTHGREAFKAALARLSPAHAKAVLRTWELSARDSQLRPVDALSIWMIVAGRGFGKALALDTPIPTPSGWTTMGALRVGDVIFDGDGRPCRVTFATEVQHGRECFEVEFDDGTKIVADADHRWLTWDKAARKSHRRAAAPTKHPSVRTTREILDTLLHPRPDGAPEANHSIANAGPLDLPDADLPIDPYVLGAWLGDGSSREAAITSMDEEILGQIRAAGYALGAPRSKVNNKASTYIIRGQAEPRRGHVDVVEVARRRAAGESRAEIAASLDVSLSVLDRRYQQAARDADGPAHGFNSFSRHLRELGVWGNKHIPATYLRASVRQRVALLQGLMDTDGHVARDGGCDLCFTNPALCFGALELVLSLGVKAVMSISHATLNGRIIGLRGRIKFTPYFQVVRLTRKLVRQHAAGRQATRQGHRFIKAIRPVLSVPVRCITVDSPSHLFLCSRAMIPTHNTRAGTEHDLNLHEDKGPFEGALISKTMTDLERDVIGGKGGILRCAERRGIPARYVANKRVELGGPRGTTILHVFSAEQDEFGRGPNISYFRADEIAAWRASAFPVFLESFLPSWRVPFSDGSPMLGMITTSPKPNAISRYFMRSAEMRDVVTLTGGRSEENRHIRLNAAALAIRGSRRWLQEYEGQLLDSAALVDQPVIDKYRIDRIPELTRIVIGVDPGVRAHEDADATGIVVVGVGTEYPQHGYVLEDLTVQGMHGLQWARTVVAAGRQWASLARVPVTIVAETNNGGDLILDQIRTAQTEAGGDALAFSLEPVFATKSKRARAEAVAPLYELGRVHHLNTLPQLEREWVSWVEGAPSPNTLDAAVHALSHALMQGTPLQVWSEFE